MFYLIFSIFVIAIDDNSKAMTFEKVKRGDLYGPIFEVEHLATFSVGSKQGKLGKIHVFLIISFQKVNFFLYV